MLSARKDGSVLILEVDENRIDAASAIHLKDEFRAAVADHDGRVVMDLRSVNFMDSSGLGAMVAALKLLGGRKLELCTLTPTVDKVFKLTRMDKVFMLHTDMATALSHDGSKGQDAA
ncbi:anti-sigma B factor antagonist [Litoreibacter ponti]|uniref:Anti-sigma factor antagonist n=1 Tax=Litoreibacter ponti TaxID=1510457 RepID=A0A2T6BNN1_9RHOB|nr:STAS domain-containing protein [Litoreibacter ponti]PTX57688.1 anti-sigma B factor antagonist [Litoreibacter ponti]